MNENTNQIVLLLFCQDHKEQYCLNSLINFNNEEVCLKTCKYSECHSNLKSKICFGKFDGTNLDLDVTIFSESISSKNIDVLRDFYVNFFKSFYNNNMDKINLYEIHTDFLTNLVLKTLNNIFKENEYSMDLFDVGGGGDCFFYCTGSIMKELYNMSFNPYDLRNMVKNHVLEMSDEIFNIHKAVYEGPDYMLNIKDREMLSEILLDNKFDADETAINVIGQIFKIKFLIFDTRYMKFKSAGCDGNSYELIACLCYNGGHYVRGTICRNVYDETTNNITKLQLFTCFKKEHIMNNKNQEMIKLFEFIKIKSWSNLDILSDS